MINFYTTENVGDTLDYTFKGEDYHAIGVKIDGDSNNVYWYWTLKDYPKMILPLDMFPGYNMDRIDFNLLNVQKEFGSGFLSLDFKIDDKFFYIVKKGDKYVKASTILNENIDITVNDKSYDSLNFISQNDSDDLYYHMEIKSNSNIENQNIKFISRDSYNMIDDLKEVKNINTKNSSNYSIDFDSGETQTIINPISFDGTKMQFEKISFYKDYKDKYYSPTTTSDIFSIYYEDELNNYIWTSPDNISLKIYLKGYDKENSTFNLRSFQDNDKNKYKYIINDHVYYDEESKTIKRGISKKYLNENGIVLPWDLSNNNGIIIINFEFSTYQKYSINLRMKIGNIHKLRGVDGKYQFKEVEKNESKS